MQKKKVNSLWKLKKARKQTPIEPLEGTEA
jgi:hypothetical protein